MARSCTVCGKRSYSDYCVSHKPRKPIKQIGKRASAYNTWRDEVAIPYLNSKYGRKCSACAGTLCGNKQLDVDHILSRGSNPQLKMSLDNVQYLGRFPCHFNKTKGGE